MQKSSGNFHLTIFLVFDFNEKGLDYALERKQNFLHDTIIE